MLSRIVGILLVMELLSGLALAQNPAARIAFFKPTLDPRTQARVEAMLAQPDGPPGWVDLQTDWTPYSLVVLVDPPIPAARHGRELNLSQKLATFYLLGGHVLLIGVPGAGTYPASRDAETWSRLMRYFFDTSLQESTAVLADTDHRALFVAGLEDLGTQVQFSTTLRELLEAQDRLPEDVAAEDFGSAPPIEVRPGSLWIDNKPVLLKSVGPYFLRGRAPVNEPETSFRMYHELGFNAVVVSVVHSASSDQIRGVLEAARRNNLYVQIRLHGSVDTDEPVRKEYLLRLLRFRNHPALIGWILSDDQWDVYYPFIQRENSILRKYDHRLPITSTFMDLRHPETVADWQKWKTLTDFPLDYIYPLQRDPATIGAKGELGGGLKDIDRLAANTRRIFGDQFSEQFLQAHMQNGFFEAVGLKNPTEVMLPTAGQQRLIVYHALLSGVKGLIIFYPGSLEDEAMGRGRRNELGIIWNELAPVEDILASGVPPEHLSTSDATVDASLIRSGKEAAIVVVKDQPYYNRYVDQATVDGLRIQIPADAPDCPVYQLNWPRPVMLQVRHEAIARSVVLHPFTLTALLASSCDSSLQHQLEQVTEHSLPRVAEYAISVLADEQAKTEAVAAHLPVDLRGDAALLEKTRQALRNARKASNTHDWGTDWQQARSAMPFIEDYRSQAMKAAVADADRRGASARARVYLNIYFSLPNYAFVTRGGTGVEPGQLRREILDAAENQ